MVDWKEIFNLDIALWTLYVAICMFVILFCITLAHNNYVN